MSRQDAKNDRQDTKNDRQDTKNDRKYVKNVSFAGTEKTQESHKKTQKAVAQDAISQKNRGQKPRIFFLRNPAQKDIQKKTTRHPKKTTRHPEKRHKKAPKKAMLGPKP